ncbi:tape measure protein [Pontibaca methylaminivorans]|uniref:Tape measure domain-containing protein n=1 Tax=Pontibaca methylaminivorans TaxID=515897 RepID=A0A1R3W9V3_9RHOB|nr:tape measure protein [Pontibaca methylaminivorans]SIT74770.1 tape measure domain-containing protein [Pontibaca methylaminivorans]
MADDLERLVVQLSADIRGYEREMRKATGITHRQARAVEKRFTSMQRNLDGIGRRAARSLTAPLAGVAAALGTRQILAYSDAWTVAGNKIRAAAEMSGVAARSLEEINEIARESRSGFNETAELYARLVRSAGGVAESELEIARATEIVTKAFKAGGAAASEQAAGILQLSQGLGSGLLAGDELRSVRENAPILAQVIADYFNTTIGGLKKLGEEGKLTSEEVFRAILSGQEKIGAAFAVTNTTISEGFTLLQNAMTEYIGIGGETTGVSQQIAEALTIIADNFETVADTGLKLAAVLSAALLGRSIGKMASTMGVAGAALIKFAATARTATAAGGGLAKALGGLSLAAGPVGALLGSVLAGGFILYAQHAADARRRTEELDEALEELGLSAPKTAEAIDEVAAAVDNVVSEENLRRIEKLQRGLEALRGTGGIVSAIVGDPSEIGVLLREVEGEINRSFYRAFPVEENPLLRMAADALIEFQRGDITASALLQTVTEIGATDMSEGARKLYDKMVDVAAKSAQTEAGLAALGEMPGIREAEAELTTLIDRLDILSSVGDEISDPIHAQMAKIASDFLDAKISAEDAKAALDDIGNANPDFTPILKKIGRVISALSTLRATAAELASGVTLPEDKPSAPGRPPPPPVDPGGSGGKGRSRRPREDYDRAIESTREFIAALEAEATALNEADVSLQGHQDVLTYVQKRMELLNAAKKQGIEITPQLAAEIDQLAQEYVNAGKAADQARERHEEFEGALEDFKGTMESAFTGLITGAHSFKDAIGQIISKLAEMALSKAFEGIWGGGLGNVIGATFSGLGWADGGYTGSGGKYEPAGVVHRGEYVMDAETVRKAGGPAAFDALRQKLRGYRGRNPVWVGRCRQRHTRGVLAVW